TFLKSVPIFIRSSSRTVLGQKMRPSRKPPYRLRSTRHLAAAARAAVPRVLVIAIRPTAKCAGTAPSIGSRSAGAINRESRKARVRDDEAAYHHRRDRGAGIRARLHLAIAQERRRGRFAVRGGRESGVLAQNSATHPDADCRRPLAVS